MSTPAAGFLGPPGLPILLAELERPSLSGFPVTGVLAALLLALLAAACIAAILWVDRQGTRYPIPNIEGWRLAAAAVAGVFVAAAMRFGILALPVGLLGLGTMLFLFTRLRDTHVPPTQRILTKDFRRNLRLAMQEWGATRRRTGRRRRG